MPRFVQSVAAIVVLTATASAQPAPPPAPLVTSTSGWSVLATETGRPPDASPVSWRGSGPSVLAFLLERYGAGHLKLVYHARSSQLPTRMQEVYGLPLETLGPSGASP